MALCWPSLILLILAYTTHAANYTLTTELTTFIPTCAQECFISFLDSNFPQDICGTSPTLNCLCTHNSTSGYTVGEGAVQCIISEDNIGFCQGNSAKPTVLTNAYAMCGGQANALAETHGTLTATLIVQTSMPSIVLVAPPTTTSISGSSSMLQTTSSGFTTMTSSLLTASAVRSASTSSTVSAKLANQTETMTPTSLSKPQIVGITVASIGGVAVVVGLVILLACWRRRKHKGARESDSIPFQLPPPAHLMDKKKYHYSFRGPPGKKPGGTANGVAARVPPPVPPRIDTSDPLMFSRRSIRPETIGVAISPDNAYPAEKRRRPSRLLPEKPNLKLKMPQSQEKEYTGGISFPQPILHASGVRQSTATQFEEDFESANSAVNVDDPWRRKSTDQILNSSPRNGKAVQAVYPKKERDEFTWHPGQEPNSSAAPAIYVKPLSIGGQKIGSISQPRNPDVHPQAQMEIPGTRPVTGSSSVYSSPGSVPSSDGAGRIRGSYGQTGPYDNEGIELTFSTQEVEPRAAEPRTAGTMELSPVVESPGSGRSPVSYPKIPDTVSPTIMRMNYRPLPPQPDFARVMGTGQSQQPWRAAEIKAQRERERIARGQAHAKAQVPARSLPQAIPQRAASARGHRRQKSREDPAAFNFPAPPGYVPTRSQSPYSSGQIHPALRLTTRPEIEQPPRSQTAPLTDATGGWKYNPYIPSSTPYGSKSQNQSRSRPQPQSYQLQRQNSSQIPSTATSSSTTLPNTINPLINPSWQPQIQPPLQSQTQRSQPPSNAPTRSSSAMSNHSHVSQLSKNSTASNLLAKRLGEQKASKLVLKTEEMGEAKRRQQAKWRVLGKEEQELVKGGEWRPMAGSRRIDGNGIGDVYRSGDKDRDRGRSNNDVRGGRYGEDKEMEFERMDLPSTPGWVPKLTPTRRGDELFLGVQ